MITETGNGFYIWDGKLYKSDVVRSCIKPRTKAIGKAVAKHIRTTVDKNGNKNVCVNPETYMKFLLEDPNPIMSGQMLQEKISNQLALNNNAFILIVRDENGIPLELYPIPCITVEAKYVNSEMYLEFTYRNGKRGKFLYSDIIHIRDDYFNNDLFGENPRNSLSQLMECVGTIDNGIIKAIRNSGVVKWLCKFQSAMRPEDIKRNVKNFVEQYLSTESETFGAAGVDSKMDAQRVEPKDYVPNASQMDRITKRIYAFFGTNEKIVNASYTEDEWISYYEASIEPILQQMSNEYSRKLFTRKERSFGNRIVFESSSMTFASMTTKMNLVQLVDRGIITPNEHREYLNLAPIDGGDTPIRRLDTAVVKGSDGNGKDN